MIVTYGRKCPKGYLPVYSVDTEEDAKLLISKACEKVTYGSNMEIGYLARELEKEQSLENLAVFGERLHKIYQQMKGVSNEEV